ncbi:MAG TPA: hypothetical protein VNR65_10025, partial [Geobacterales bacterium]|nr:hypothetical protein [Geobacterales bacterium]
MSIRPVVSCVGAGAIAVCFAATPPDVAHAQVNVLKECGAQFQAAKTENALKGQGWQDFLRACRVRLAEQPPPAAAPAASDAPNAQSNILKECGTQYQAAKAANKLQGQGWQDFLKICRAHVAEVPAPAKTPAAAEPAPTAAPASPSKPAAEAVAPAVAPTTVPDVVSTKLVSEGKAA